MAPFLKFLQGDPDAAVEHALMSAVLDPLLAVDPSGAPSFYNSKFTLLVGEGDLTARRLWKMFVDHEVLDGFQRALKSGESSSVRAVPFMLPSGRQFFSVSISPLKRMSGEIYGAVGVFHDVTDLKRAEQIRIDFVANVSHELRTPLTAIKGYADTLVEDLKGGHPAEPQFVEVIARNTERLMNLINDLLDLSSIESTDVLKRVSVETEEVSNRVLRQLQGRIEQKKQSVRVDARAKSVTADPQRLEQVLVNLLDNAVKYTPEGGAVSVGWEQQGHDVVLRVKDTGPGIPPEHLPRLFERFYRVDKARSREQGGTGLGLAIVKHIMERHGGAATVESEPGRGSTFICRFPL